MLSTAASRLPRHIFLSYPKLDRTFTEKLALSLREEGLEIWIDDEGIEPGTPNWESKIREAVKDSYAVVLVCSPNTIASQYVGAELKLAEKYERQILPVWAVGDEWVDCIPLGLINYQFIDCRNGAYEAGLSELIKQLRKIVVGLQPQMFIASSIMDCRPGSIPILVPTNDDDRLSLSTAALLADQNRSIRVRRSIDGFHVIAANPNKYDYFEELLDDLYLSYLRPRYQPYTYGRDWVLAKASQIGGSLLAVPWMWLRYKRKMPLIEVVPNYLSQSTPLAEYGIGAKNSRKHRYNVWAIINSEFEGAYGLFTSNEQVASQAFESIPKSLGFTMGQCRYKRDGSAEKGKLSTGVYHLDEVDPAAFKYKFVVVPDGFFIREELPKDAVFVIE